MGSERQLKDSAGRGLTSTLRPRNLDEEKQREERVKILWDFTCQAGQTISEIGSSPAGPGRRHVRLEYHRPDRALARDLNISRAGPDAVGPPSLGPVQSARVGPTRKDPWIF